MADSNQSTRLSSLLLPPPPPPPLPPSRATVLQRIIAPLSFNLGARPQNSHTSTTQSSDASPHHISGPRLHRSLPSQSVVYRTGFAINAVDINQQGTHAILGGREILRTVKVEDGRVVEDINLRSAVNSYASTHQLTADTASKRREFLPAKDVRWSHGHYQHVIAAAANAGRIALYDVSGHSRIELGSIHGQAGQINKLDFDPFSGYLLLSGSQDKTCQIWDIRDPKVPSRHNQYNIRLPVRDVRWSPTDAWEFAVCTENGVVQKWDVRNSSQAQLSINAHEKGCYTIDWHPDGRHLVSGGLDKHVRVWDFKSDNRRQRPVLQFRTPQGVMNLAWRPPCWSAELAESGNWQSTQIATGYNDADPRVHVWDLRRPLLPFREIDRHETRPTDILWASKDLLWTVGNAPPGAFTQTDMSHTPQVQDELPPCAIDFMPDGQFLSFLEDRVAIRKSAFEDPAAGFLGVSHQKLSGGDETAISRSLTDDESVESSMGSIRRRQSKAASTRSGKSQNNTPPTTDGLPHILPLDKAVLGRNDLFNDEQIGIFCQIDGVGTKHEVVQFLAENYARPSTVRERKANPGGILDNLEHAFNQNASVCDAAAMNRLAQSWRILGAVIVPELRDWADANRKERTDEARRKAKEREARNSAQTEALSTWSKDFSRLTDVKSPARSEKAINHLFRGAVESGKLKSDAGSTSNMTTPLAKPRLDSPLSGKRDQTTWFTLNDIEPMVPLPPSVITSHFTAAAASKALIDTNSDPSNSPASSPERLRNEVGSNKRHRRNLTDVDGRSRESLPKIRSPPAQKMPVDGSNVISQQQKSPIPQRMQEDKRAALRDYRAQARPLFTLEAPAQSPEYRTNDRHNSAESFSMFSPSTASSQRGKSFGMSLESPKQKTKTRRDSEEWQKVGLADSFDSTSLSGGNGKYAKRMDTDCQEFSETATFEMDETPELTFVMDGPSEPEPKPKNRMVSEEHSSTDLWRTVEEENTSSSLPHSETAASSSSEPLFHFEQAHPPSHHRIHTSNPLHRPLLKKERFDIDSIDDVEASEPDMESEHYMYKDFRPIDFARYEPRLPFAWSLLPLICETVAYDMMEGIACAQFSVHLLMHVHPFVFHHGFRSSPPTSSLTPVTLTERLMRPDLSDRVIEGLFLNHYNYLKRMKLYGPMAELRKLCVEFDYPALYKIEQMEQSVGAGLQEDPVLLKVSCTHCHAPLSTTQRVCRSCEKPRNVCPICDAINPPLQKNGQFSNEATTNSGLSNLWSFCHACGHSAHISCMEIWLLQSSIEGQCPTQNCDCDCGPGVIRHRRITRQLEALEDNESIRGPSVQSGSVTKPDPIKPTRSPAVDKARDTLRNSRTAGLGRDRATQSGDESTNAFGAKRRESINTKKGVREGNNRRGGGLGRTGSDSNTPRATKAVVGMSSSGRDNSSFGSRRVRLITPGEQKEEDVSGAGGGGNGGPASPRTAGPSRT